MNNLVDSILDSLLDDIPENTDTGLDHIESVETNEDIEIVSEHNFFMEGFSSGQIVDVKEYNRFIKNVERLVRCSAEYSKYIGWLKAPEVGLTRCSILSNVTTDDASIEMHHYPFSLYDLCDIVASKQFESSQRITSFSVANEVLSLHYKNLIGIVPLSETMHQLAHSGSIVINLKQVFGKVIEFLNLYKDYIKEEDMQKLQKLVVMSKQNLLFENQSFLKLNEINENANTNLSLQSIHRLQQGNTE